MRYKVSFEVVLDDNDPSAPDWIKQAVQDCLDTRTGEYVSHFELEPLS